MCVAMARCAFARLAGTKMGIYRGAMTRTSAEGAARRRLLVWPGTQVGGLGRPTVPLIARDVRIGARRGQGDRGRREDELAVSRPRMADGGRMATPQQCRPAGWLGAAGCAMPNSGVHYQHNAVENT